MNRNKFDCPLIAKIENRQGIENMDEILEVSDGIMIVRGDIIKFTERAQKRENR
jgi:pyruvate kinase